MLPGLLLLVRSSISVRREPVRSHCLPDFLTQGGCILFVGQILTIVPNKTVLLLSIILFEAGSLICAVSQSMPILIFGRAVSGCGAAG